MIHIRHWDIWLGILKLSLTYLYFCYYSLSDAKMTIGPRQPIEIFKDICKSNDFKEVRTKFNELCYSLNVDRNDHLNLYKNLKDKFSLKDAKGLWTHIDKKAQQKVYLKGKACQGKKVIRYLSI